MTQYFATSKDGTAIPYFVVRPPAAGRARTHAAVWLRRIRGVEDARLRRCPGPAVAGPGGTYVLANIRGGGEYGPALAHPGDARGPAPGGRGFRRRGKGFGGRGITTVEQLGAQGGSNGGLLMGIMLTQYPELFGALVCSVPLLDMRRFHLLLAGASWVAEYGDPDDPDDWEFIAEVLAVPEHFGRAPTIRRC